MSEWSTIAETGTAAGTLILAVVTFRSVRSADRTARAAERALQVTLRPLLVPSRVDDPPEEVIFGDGHSVRVPGDPPRGGIAVIEDAMTFADRPRDDMYLVMWLRNIGAGLAVLYGWSLRPGRLDGVKVPPAGPERFEGHYRSLYVAPSSTGYWQARLGDAERSEVRKALETAGPLTVDLLYGDEEGGQGRISRVHVRREGTQLLCSVARHWRLDDDRLDRAWRARDGRLAEYLGSRAPLGTAALARTERKDDE